MRFIQGQTVVPKQNGSLFYLTKSIGTVQLSIYTNSFKNEKFNNFIRWKFFAE